MKYIGILLCTLFLGACGSKKIPKKIIPINEMKLVMWDMMKMDEYYVRITIQDTLHKLNQEQFRLYEQVFQSYKIRRQDFYKSYDFYQSNPIMFKILLDSVEAISNRQKTMGYAKKYNKVAIKK